MKLWPGLCIYTVRRTSGTDIYLLQGTLTGLMKLCPGLCMYTVRRTPRYANWVDETLTRSVYVHCGFSLGMMPCHGWTDASTTAFVCSVSVESELQLTGDQFASGKSSRCGEMESKTRDGGLQSKGDVGRCWMEQN